MEAIDKLRRRGIDLRGSITPGGTHKARCPKCSNGRKHKNDLCLSVTIDADGENAVWNCFNCTDAGTTKWDDHREDLAARRRAPPVRPQDTIERPTPEVIRWFNDRGISLETVQRNRVGYVREHYIAQLGGRVPCIAFRYYRSGELINVKYRALKEKGFAQVKGAEAIPYGLDNLDGIGADEKVIIVEGECDLLACQEAGFTRVLSVPDGAPAKLRDEPSAADGKFAFLGNCADELETVKAGFILAVDNDAAGKVLEEELARRLGRERCWRVHWPDSNDLVCKDANETLMWHGPETLRECIAQAEPYPITGLHTWDDYEADFAERYDVGRRRGLSTGWLALDEFMTVAPGQLTVVTGIPSHGKSEFLDALFVNLARRHGWRFALCSFENEPVEHMIKLAEKQVGAPFSDGPTRRMTRDERCGAFDWGRERFFFIRADAEDDAPPTIDWILEKARAAVLRYGVNGLVVDPYNEVEHRRPPNMTETEYISQTLGKAKRFALNHGVHLWFVAHPVKPLREPGGKISVPTLYDISGSANWANKADVGLAVHRPDLAGDLVEIHIQKVRHKWVGKPGGATLRYDRVTGRYSEVEPAAGARGYWAD